MKTLTQRTVIVAWGAMLLASLLLMGYRRRQFFLVRGQLDAPIEPVRWLGYSKPEPWTTPGITDAR